MAVTLAYEAMGSGPPVVILHGLFGSGSNWRTVARALAGTHRVYLVDLRNHGASPWTDTMTYLSMADDVRGFVEREELRAPTVIGHSMGGKTAMALALLSPDLVGRLVVVDIAPVSYADRFSSYLDVMRSIDLLAVASRAEVLSRLTSGIPEQGVADFLMLNLVARNERFDWRINLAGITSSVADLCDFPPQLYKRRFLGRAMLITGARSDYLKPADHRPFRALFPKLESHVIDRAGHWVHVDQPDAFLSVLRCSFAATPAEIL